MSAGPPPAPSQTCLSDEVFRGLLSMPTQASHADANVVAITLFVFLILLGLGLLLFGAVFDRLFRNVAFGLVFWLITFVGTYAFLIVDNRSEHCVWPIITATVVTLVVALAIYILQRLLDVLRPLFNFLTGFTLGALAMLVLFIFIEQATDWSMLVSEERLPLYGFAVGTILVAIIGGVGAMYFLPVVDILLRCAAGGYAFASGVSGICSNLNSPLEPHFIFYLIFGGSALAGALLQLCYTRRQKAAEQAEGKPSEASRLVKP